MTPRFIAGSRLSRHLRKEICHKDQSARRCRDEMLFRCLSKGFRRHPTPEILQNLTNRPKPPDTMPPPTPLPGDKSRQPSPEKSTSEVKLAQLQAQGTMEEWVSAETEEVQVHLRSPGAKNDENMPFGYRNTH